ncbi:MAG: ribosome maturation factor RimM [Bacteroidales bacterium]|nr:ribosome maturation factor RimM [Bacteroidales bacterium]
MIEKDDCVRVGKIAKSHGVNGEVVVRAESGFDVDDLSYEFLLVEIDGGLVPFYVEEIRVKNNEDALVKFELIETQDDTRRLAGRDVYICREWAETEEGDLEDVSTGMLIGYMAFDKESGKLGVITEIDDQVGANPLFVIDNEGEELLVPIADEFVKEVNDENRTVVFELPEGLVDMNK